MYVLERAVLDTYYRGTHGAVFWAGRGRREVVKG